MTITLRPLIISTLCGALILYLYQQHHFSSFFPTTSSMSHSESPLSGYLSRSTPLSPTTPLSRENIKLAILHNAPVETEGFTLALFAPDIAVTYHGTIVQLQPQDFSGILDLASHTSTLPTPSTFFNAWVINQARTSQPIDRVLIPLGTLSKEPKYEYKDEYREVSVRGYEQGKTELKEEVGGFKELPGVLDELVGLALEAREEEEGEGKDEDVVRRVKNVLGHVYP
ncbi:hypothetical protein BDQ17DRAFT_1368130 [Cyathus striatus]|nr:hypothetical protein BDQ17DRAFT_1368130 [Cyathus striatus]